MVLAQAHRDPQFREMLLARSKLHIIDEDARKPEALVGRYLRLRYNPVEFPEQNNEAFLGAQAKDMMERIKTIPATYMMLTYEGAEVQIPGTRDVLVPGEPIALSHSKVTEVYGSKYIHQLMQAGLLAEDQKDEDTRLKLMSGTTKVLRYAATGQEFIQFTDIEDKQEAAGIGSDKTGFLMLAYMDPRLRGYGLSRDVLVKTLEHFRDRHKVDLMWGYGRLPQMHEDSIFRNHFEATGKMKPDHVNLYLLQSLTGIRRDFGLKLHERAGAVIACGLPDSVGDIESLNCGFMAIYDLKRIRQRLK